MHFLTINTNECGFYDYDFIAKEEDYQWYLKRFEGNKHETVG